MVGENDFIVLTKKAAQSFREMAGIDMDEKTIRAIILKSLTYGKCVHSREEEKGDLRIIRTRVYSFPHECEVMLVWGKDGNGNPCMSPDGKKQVVFIVSFKSRRADFKPQSTAPEGDKECTPPTP